MENKVSRRGVLQAGMWSGLVAILAACGKKQPSTQTTQVEQNTSTSSSGATQRKAKSEYSPLQEPNEHGLRLPTGFSSRVIATSGEIVAGSDYAWHVSPDGGATYETDDGGWIYVSNSESITKGGVGAVRFSKTGEIITAYSILSGSVFNCAGGKTPWGTWLSCEEMPRGMVYECDPKGEKTAVSLPSLGNFAHEAVAVDPDEKVLYLSEDQSDGALYKFVPDAWPSLTTGKLQVLTKNESGTLQWKDLLNPNPPEKDTDTRLQHADTVRFAGGEGIYWHNSQVYLTTKHDNKIHMYNTKENALKVVYDAATFDTPILTGVDNLIVHEDTGEVFVAEDGGDLQIVCFTPDGKLFPIMQVADVDPGKSEITGLAFDPTGTRLYFSSQRVPGKTYEISGPFV